MDLDCSGACVYIRSHTYCYKSYKHGLSRSHISIAVIVVCVCLLLWVYLSVCDCLCAVVCEVLSFVNEFLCLCVSLSIYVWVCVFLFVSLSVDSSDRSVFLSVSPCIKCCCPLRSALCLVCGFVPVSVCVSVRLVWGTVGLKVVVPTRLLHFINSFIVHHLVPHWNTT